MADKHVIVWMGENAQTVWFERILKVTMNTEQLFAQDYAIRTDKFSEAYVFDSFEEALKVYESASIEEATGESKPYILYYTDQEYFKELLRQE